MIQPDIVLYNALKGIVNFLRRDIKEKSEEDSFLHKILIGEDGERIQINGYDYYEQAKKIIAKPDNLFISFGFSPEIAKGVSLCIVLTNEDSSTSVGSNEGYVTTYTIDEFQDYIVRVYDNHYQIIISSSNIGETNVIFNVLKPCIIAITDMLELQGLRLPSIGGSDINLQDNLAPNPYFHRSINLKFKTEIIVPQIFQKEILKGINFQGNPKEYID